jgi:hypothetical protein
MFLAWVALYAVPDRCKERLGAGSVRDRDGLATVTRIAFPIPRRRGPPLLLENARLLLGDRTGPRPFHCNPGRFYIRLSGKNPSTKENEKRMETGVVRLDRNRADRRHVGQAAHAGAGPRWPAANDSPRDDRGSGRRSYCAASQVHGTYYGVQCLVDPGGHPWTNRIAGHLPTVREFVAHLSLCGSHVGT